MDNRGKNFITIMVIIAISAVLLRVITVRVIERNIAQNKTFALGTIKLIAAALENYAKGPKGLYPVSFQALTETKPPYLDKDYITQSSIRGYTYNCSRLEPSGYNCSAAPTICKVTGSAVFTITSGGLLVSEECDKKE